MSLGEITNEVSAGRERGPRMSPEAPDTEKRGETSKVELEGAASEAGRTPRKDGILNTKKEKLPRRKQ